MNITVTDISPSRKKIEVTIPAETVNQTEAKVFKDFTRYAKLEGFRPGKAPVAMIKARFADKIQKEWADELQRNAYQFAQKESKLSIFSILRDKEDFAPTKDQAATVTLEVDVWPDVELKDYKGIELTVPPIQEISDEALDRELIALRRRLSPIEATEAPAALDGYVKISYEGTCGDEPLADLENVPAALAKGKSSWEYLALPDDKEVHTDISPINEALVGKKKGDEFEVNHTYDKDFHVEALRGKQVVYKVSVEDVCERKLLEEEAFLNQMKLGSMDEVRTKLKEERNSNFKMHAMERRAQQVLQFIRNSNEIHIPQTAIDQRLPITVDKFSKSEEAKQFTAQDLEVRRDELVARFRQEANEELQNEWILKQIAEKENLFPTPEELTKFALLEARIKRLKDPVAYIQSIAADNQARQELISRALEYKAIAFLVEAAKFTEVPEGSM